MPYISKRKICFNLNKNEANTKEIKKHNKWTKYYQNPMWKKLRDWYMLTHPLCEDCMFEGRSVPSEECHHKISFGSAATEEERMKLLLDENNLVALCHMHHKKRHGYLNR